VRNQKYTEREYRCDNCGQMFSNSQLVKRRVETGHSRKRKYYNDRLVCKSCAKNHDVGELIKLIIISPILLIIFSVFYGILKAIFS